MRELYITGTCTNCMNKFRLSAYEVANLKNIFCPNCGVELKGEKIIGTARDLLEKYKNLFNIGWTCTKCKKQYSYNVEEAAKLEEISCPYCLSRVDERNIRLVAQSVLKKLNK